MPVEQPATRQGDVALRRIEHHLDDTLDIAIRWQKPADFDSEPTGDRRAHLVPIKLLAFDIARFKDFLGEAMQHGFRAKLETEALHPSDQTPLGCRTSTRSARCARGPSGSQATLPLVNVDLAFYSPRHVHRI